MKNKHGMLLILVVSVSVFSLLSIIFSFGNKSLGKTNRQELGPTNHKKITRMQIPEEPYEVTDFKIKSKEAKLGRTFEADGDWLKSFEFNFKNKRDKPIICILLRIDFPETKSDRPMMAHQITIGQRPNANTKQADTLGSPIFLIKDDTLSFKLSTSDYERIERFIARRGYSIASLTAIQLHIYQIYFSDGSLWVNGVNYLPDSASPNGYRRVQ